MTSINLFQLLKPSALKIGFICFGLILAMGAQASEVNLYAKNKLNAKSELSGMSMVQVVATEGEPTMKHATVGQPPITRWDYSRFSVYFEGKRVLHSVMADGKPN